MIYDIMNDKQRKDYEEFFLEIDFPFEISRLTCFRVNAYNNPPWGSGRIRTISYQTLILEELKAPPIFKDIDNNPRGIALVTEPTGSGKSTTLAAWSTIKAKMIMLIFLLLKIPLNLSTKVRKA